MVKSISFSVVLIKCNCVDTGMTNELNLRRIVVDINRAVSTNNRQVNRQLHPRREGAFLLSDKNSCEAIASAWARNPEKCVRIIRE